MGTPEENMELLRAWAHFDPGVTEIFDEDVEAVAWAIVQIEQGAARNEAVQILTEAAQRMTDICLRRHQVLQELATLLDGVGLPGHAIGAGQCARVRELLAEYAAGYNPMPKALPAEDDGEDLDDN